jgi:light-regulated signal transduction histidine kinase (bacteriophytochrome)
MIAVLMATLTFENWRAYSRATAAEIAERRLAELNRSLEQEIASRTSELANRTKDLQTIADSVAHDLRNPLNSISVNVQLFELQYKDLLGSEALAILNRVSPAVHQMSEILDRMLGLSTVAHSTFKAEPLDMSELVREVFDGLVIAEPPPAIALELNKLPPVNADRNLVKMLIMNLLSNALKYTRKSENRRIRVSCEMSEHGPAYCVSDNGIGFDPNSANVLFTAFRRLDNDDNVEGIGLGLAIAARVVERHRGQIWATGAPGKGAEFCFTLQPARNAAREA